MYLSLWHEYASISLFRACMSKCLCWLHMWGLILKRPIHPSHICYFEQFHPQVKYTEAPKIGNPDKRSIHRIDKVTRNNVYNYPLTVHSISSPDYLVDKCTTQRPQVESLKEGDYSFVWSLLVTLVHSSPLYNLWAWTFYWAYNTSMVPWWIPWDTTSTSSQS